MKFGKYLNNESTLSWVFGILIVVLSLLFGISYFLPTPYNWIRDLIGLLGGIASLLGILLALLQNINTNREVNLVKDISLATQKAAEETKASIRKTFSIVHLTKYCEQIRRVQEYISHNELKLVLHISQELQEIAIELNKYIEHQDLADERISLSSHIKKLGINIALLRKGISDEATKIKLDNISNDFDRLHDTMLEIKNRLTE